MELQGEKEGHNLLGIMYRDGLGVPVNVGSAKAYFQAAAQMDLAEAKVHLGKFAGESLPLPPITKGLPRC